MSTVWLLLLALIVLAVGIAIGIRRESRVSVRNMLDAGLDSGVRVATSAPRPEVRKHEYHGPPEFIHLLKAIQSLGEATFPTLEQLRQVSHLLDVAYPMHLTRLQQKRIETVLPPVVIGKTVSWQLTVHDVDEREHFFSLEGRGFCVEHVESDPRFKVNCQTSNADVLSLQRGQLVSAYGYISGVEIQWPTLLLMVSSASVHELSNGKMITDASVRVSSESPRGDDLFLAASEVNTLDNRTSNSLTGPSYQTAPLVEYPEKLQDVAEDLFEAVRPRIGNRTKRYKGSFSLLARSSSETAAKLVIYQRGLGRENGRWPALANGVYVLIRCNGSVGAAIRERGLLSSPHMRLDASRTIGIAPKHDERFAYYLLEPRDDLGTIAELIIACSSV
jgi:hypothetical protein